MLFFALAGMGLSGFEIVSLVYVSEISAERFRNFSGVILTAVWAAAQVILTTMVYYVTDWRYLLTGVIGIPFLLSLILIKKYLYETPRYLTSKKRFMEARLILNNIALFNGKITFKSKLEGEGDLTEGILNAAGRALVAGPLKGNFEDSFAHLKREDVTYNYLTLFKYDSLKNVTIYLMYVWFLRYYAYFCITFSLASFGSEIHQNVIITSLFEFFACILTAPIKLRFDRVRSLSVSLMFVTGCCTLLIFFPIPEHCLLYETSCSEKTWNLIFVVIAKFSITVYLGVLLTYTGEVYPTVVRSSGYGICMTIGRSGSILMPIIVAWCQSKGYNPLVIISIFGTVGLFLLRRLPETFGRYMTDYIGEEDAKNRPLLGEDDHCLLYTSPSPRDQA
eukprot:TRINITY_DN1383_c0_g1_i15.p1 TRINITY_DN1383_c0_g1~~TRINITY_DN1383_c0_g1_i15.p1  ORF type:complete len:392 (-),score=26.03 TRINITY_DN1383_c0_g1_i15:97-1272(-)